MVYFLFFQFIEGSFEHHLFNLRNLKVKCQIKTIFLFGFSCQPFWNWFQFRAFILRSQDTSFVNCLEINLSLSLVSFHCNKKICFRNCSEGLQSYCLLSPVSFAHCFAWCVFCLAFLVSPFEIDFIGAFTIRSQDKSFVNCLEIKLSLCLVSFHCDKKFAFEIVLK